MFYDHLLEVAKTLRELSIADVALILIWLHGLLWSSAELSNSIHGQPSAQSRSTLDSREVTERIASVQRENLQRLYADIGILTKYLKTHIGRVCARCRSENCYRDPRQRHLRNWFTPSRYIKFNVAYFLSSMA